MRIYPVSRSHHWCYRCCEKGLRETVNTGPLSVAPCVVLSCPFSCWNLVWRVFTFGCGLCVFRIVDRMGSQCLRWRPVSWTVCPSPTSCPRIMAIPGRSLALRPGLSASTRRPPARATCQLALISSHFLLSFFFSLSSSIIWRHAVERKKEKKMTKICCRWTFCWKFIPAVESGSVLDFNCAHFFLTDMVLRWWTALLLFKDLVLKTEGACLFAKENTVPIYFSLCDDVSLAFSLSWVKF